MAYASPLPITAATVTSLRGVRTHPVTGEANVEHNGMDFAAPIGTPVYSAASGQVSAAVRNDAAAGNYLIIDHDDGNRTAYLHLYSIMVNRGQAVEKGQMIGQVGNTGRSTGPHLHFEVRKRNPNGGTDIRLDPLDFLPYTYRVSNRLQSVLGSDIVQGGAAIGGGVVLAALAAGGVWWWLRRGRR